VAKQTAEQIIKRADRAWVKKEEFRSLYSEAYEFAVPQRNMYDGYYDGGVGGAKKMNRVFDSTAINSTQRFANRMQAGVFPAQSRWSRMEPGDDIPIDKRPAAQRIFDIYANRKFTVMRSSRFDIAIGEFLLDLAVGTACMLVQPGGLSGPPVSYTAVPEYLVAIEEGPDGSICAVHRRPRVKGEDVMHTWRDAKISGDLKKLIADKPMDEIEFAEMTRYDYDDGYWYYCVVWKQKKEIIVERRKRYSPWVIARYMKAAGEVYGRGPVITALPDIKTLNKTLELLLKNASIGVAGVYTGADDGILNPQTVRIIPGAIIPVARNGGPQGPSLMPLKAGGDINLTQIIINDLRMSIRAALIDDSQPLDTQAPRSATEYIDRAQKLAQNLGSAFGRLINETLIPIDAATLAVMDERGIIDLPLKVDGMEVRVVPIAEIAMAQHAKDIEQLMNFANVSAMLDQLPATHINKDAAKDYVADKMGIPMSIRLDAEERKRLAEEQVAAQEETIAAAAPAAGAAIGQGMVQEMQKAA
jgi:hypothetical protein